MEKIELLTFARRYRALCQDAEALEPLGNEDPCYFCTDDKCKFGALDCRQDWDIETARKFALVKAVLLDGMQRDLLTKGKVSEVLGAITDWTALTIDVADEEDSYFTVSISWGV